MGNPAYIESPAARFGAMAGDARDPQSRLLSLRTNVTTSDTYITDWKYANKPTPPLSFATGGVPCWGFRFFGTTTQNKTYQARLSGWREGDSCGRELLTVDVKLGNRSTDGLTKALLGTTLYEADTLTVSNDMIDYQVEAVADKNSLLLVDVRAHSWLAWEVQHGDAVRIEIVGAPGGA